MTCLKCQHGTAKRFGYFGKCRIQRWRCTSCKATSCEPHKRLTRARMLSRPDAAVRALQCLLEGCSIRSTEGLTGLNRNTIMRLLVVAGERSEPLLDAMMRDLHCRRMQIDEIWTFVAKKNRRVRKTDSPEFGDQRVFVALDADAKLVPWSTLASAIARIPLRSLATFITASLAVFRSPPMGCTTTGGVFLSSSGWMLTLRN